MGNGFRYAEQVRLLHVVHTVEPEGIIGVLGPAGSKAGVSTMIEGDFNPRTLANMNVALERVCARTPLGQQHEVRKRVARGIIRCAKTGKTTLGALTQAGERALSRIPEKRPRSA